MRKAVLHAEGRVCRHPGCNTILSVYNPDKTCNRHAEPLTVKEARRCLITEGTEEQKATSKRYKARVRTGIVKPKRRYKVTAWAKRAREVASKLMDKAVREATKGGK